MPIKPNQQIKSKLGKYSNLIILVLTILMAISLIRNIIRIRKVDDKIDMAREKVVKLKKKNIDLQAQLEIAQSDEYIERQIRNELGLVKEGERIVVLPEDAVLEKLVVDRPQKEESLPDPIWKKWAKMFGI